MHDLDWKTVRVSDLSVADLVSFDTLMARLPERDQEIINRKIAFQVSEGDHAAQLEDASEEIDGLHDDLKKLNARLEELEANLKAERTLRLGADQSVKELDAQITTLRGVVADAEIRHARELQEAEVRGFHRGQKDRRAAS